MTDVMETLWTEFFVETEEHLQIVEPLLIAAETADIVAQDIAQLFRSIHSIKGMARAMGMVSMEQVAHHAETLLGLVRDGTARLDGDGVALLLRAADALRDLRGVAIDTRADGVLPAELIRALEARASALGQAPGETAAPAAAPCPPESDPGIDPAMVEAYREIIAARLPNVARLAGAADADVAAAAADAETLRYASEMMGLTALCEPLAGLHALASATLPVDSAAAAALLREFAARAAAILARTGIDLLGPEAAALLPAPPAAPDKPAAQQQQPAGGSAVVRVRGETIDALMTQVGELVTIGNLIHMSAGNPAMAAALAQLRDIAAESPRREAILGCVSALQNGLLSFVRGDEQLTSLLGRLQDATLELRVVPVDTVFSRFPRVVRDIAQSTGKRVRLDLEGTEVRVDKGMLEALVDPLVHMVRNAVDHGIEPPDERAAAGKPAVARVLLRAANRNNQVVIEIVDDGRGMNLERIAEKAIARRLASAADIAAMTESQIFGFIFAPGFSTAEKVTETSGRGVGMDVVQTSVTRLGGVIEVTSAPGHGTVFTLKLPLSAAIQRVLMVEAAGQTIAIPERCLAEIVKADTADLQVVCDQPALLLRNSYLPVFGLGELLGFGPRSGDATRRPERCPERRNVVVLMNEQHRIGLLVDRLLNRQELFVKEMHPQVAAIPGIGGVSTTGDGRVVIIIDADDLVRLAARQRRTAPLVA